MIANCDYNDDEEMYTDLLPGHGVCSCAEIDDGATIEAGKNKVKSGTPDSELEDGVQDEECPGKLPGPTQRASQTKDDDSLVLLGRLQGEEEGDREGDDDHQEGEQLQDPRETFQSRMRMTTIATIA